MLFNSFIFLFFLAILLPSYYLCNTKKQRNLLLLAASYFFYGYWDWRFCGLLLVSTFIDFFVGLSIHKATSRRHKKWLLLLSLFSNLGILGFFKYFDFFVDSFERLLDPFGMSLDFLHMNIILPVGISFYTFQTLSYTIDIYRNRLKPTQSLTDFALYVSFFAQLVAGPIERATQLIPQVSKKQSASKEQWLDGIILIVYGLFKKVLIGDAAGRYVDHIFSQMDYYSSWELVFALFMFSIQIYADFSGYSNIARGCAKLLGFELMKNFEQPYLSLNITEFWRRWHISLSSWLRDYLYISLGGNRISVNRTYVNLMITMLLGGLWHGASWNFVIWGLLHGIYLSVHKIFLKGKRITADKRDLSGLRGSLNFMLLASFTYLLVVFTWLFFRARDFSDIETFFQAVQHWTWGAHPLRFASILAGYTAMTMLFDIAEYKTGSHVFLKLLPRREITYGVLIVMFVSVCFYMIHSQPMPFIYFQF